MQYDNLDYFTSMENIQKWSTMSSKTMEVLRMPPGGIDPNLNPLHGVRRFHEYETVYQWFKLKPKFNKEDEDALIEVRNKIEKK